VQQIRSLCHDRKGIRHEMEQLDQRCRTEAVELRAQLSAAQARFAAAKLEGDRLRRELAGPWEEGNAAAIQEMRFLQTHVEGLRVGCGMVAEHMTSMRAEVANYQSRVEQLYAEERRAGEEAGAAEDQRSATESELRRVREAMLQSFQETSELQQKFLRADQDFAAVKEAAAKDAHTAVQTLEEELLSVREDEALCWKKCEDAKARLITARSEEAAALAELQLKDEHLNNLRRLYEREREGSFLREEQFMQSQRKSLQDQSEKLEKSGGLISIEMHERILHDQTEFYDKALQALDDLERSCMDRTQDCIAASFCSEPESQVGLLRGEIAAEACATATMEQDAELLEEQIRVLSQKLEASASQIAQLKESLLVERSCRDAFRSSLGTGCGAPEVVPEDSADLFTLRAALSSRHQEIAEFEAKMIEAQDEELRLRKKLPLLEAQAADSASQAEAAVGRLGTLRRQLAEASAQTAWRWQQLPQLQRALRELVGTQRDILAGLRSQTLDGLNFDALCMDLPQFPVGDGAARSPVVSQVHALGRELKAELQASRGALRSTMTSLHALEPSFEAEAGRAGEVLEILCASLPPDLPDSVQSLLDKAHLQAVAREEVPSQILDALVAEIRASLQAGRDVKEREAVQAAAAGFRAAQKPKPSRPELSALQGRSATAAAQVADLSARLYTLGRDMCDAETDSSEQVLQAEAALCELCRQTEDAGAEQRKATESAAQLRKALEGQISTTTAAINRAAEEAKESLQRAVAEASAETEALSEMLPSEIARMEEACAQQIRAKEDDLKAAASRCRSPWRRKLEELAGQQHDLETRQSENSERWAKESEDAQKELDEVWKSLATARKEIQAIREVRGSCEKATEKHRDRLWDVEQTATDVKERRTVELRRAEMELQQQLRGYAERTQELEIQIRHEEEDQQQTWREGAMALAAELTPELDEVLKVHAELEAETLRLLQRGKDQLFAHAGA